MPEPLAFATMLIASALPPGCTADSQSHPRLVAGLELAPSEGWGSIKPVLDSSQVPCLKLSDCHVSQEDLCNELETGFRAAALLGAIGVVQSAAGAFDNSAGIPEALHLAQSQLQQLQDVAGLPQVSPVPPSLLSGACNADWQHQATLAVACQLNSLIALPCVSATSALAQQYAAGP